MFFARGGIFVAVVRYGLRRGLWAVFTSPGGMYVAVLKYDDYELIVNAGVATIC